MPAIFSKAKTTSIAILLLGFQNTLASQLPRNLPDEAEVCTERHANLSIMFALTAIVGVILGIAIKSLIDCCSSKTQSQPKVESA